MPGLFPMAVGDMALDIQDTPPGSVAKVVAREAIASYHLDELIFQPGDVILDIGAHVGVMSIYLAKKWPETHIIAVEPHPANYDNLCRNIEANHVRNITVYRRAIADETGTLTLRGNHTQNTGGMGVCNVSGESVTVPSITLHDLLLPLNIDRIALLKMDCEGAEYQVLESSATLLNRVDRLIGEFHEGDHTPNAAELLEYVKMFIPFVNVSICKV
jgi:FkbM family methyltransferase